MITFIRSIIKFKNKFLFTAVIAVMLTFIHSVAYAIVVSEINLAGSDGEADASMGKDNSPVTIIEYGDYQCPFSAQYYQIIESKIRNDYVKSGKVKIIFKNQQFLGRESILAATAAECAKEQGQFWPYHDALYETKIKDYSHGGTENDGVFNRDLFLRLAERVGLDTSLFMHCYDSNKYSDTVKSESATATAQGIRSTPAVFVNSQLVRSPISYSNLQSMIDSGSK